ncbi:MAG: sigma-70 family RNA polymerase sigma factor [Myxococcota bacterium]
MLDPVFANRLIRREWSRVVGTAMRILGDLDRAEDVAQFALLRAVERWPADGVPRDPGAWLTTVAKRRALNLLRDEAKQEALDDVEALAGDEAELDLDALPDDRLALMVLCCHPALSHTSQVALILRLAGGLSTTEIGRAYVTPTATVGQRIARAKATLRDAGARFEMPDPAELESFTVVYAGCLGGTCYAPVLGPSAFWTWSASLIDTTFADAWSVSRGAGVNMNNHANAFASRAVRDVE